MKKLINLYFVIYLLLAGMVITQISCTSTKRYQISAAREEAFTDFKNFVANAEISVSNEADDVADKWRETTATIESTYKQKENQLEQYADSWSDERKEEIASLKNRYKTFREKRENDYQARMANQTQMSATSSNGGVSADFNTSQINTIPATNIRLAFENFINRIQANKESYTREDWLTIGSYYEALEARRETVENQLTDNDKYEIAKAKTKYAALKSTSIATPYVKEAASDIKDATKSGAKKVGNAAEKAGSEVKSTTKKAVNKVDNKIDDIKD